MKILIYLTGGVHWLGGVQYTRNLLKALALLPHGERPEIVLHVGHKNAGHGYEEEFSSYANVAIDGLANGAGTNPLATAALRWARRIFKAGIPLPKLHSEGCEVAFPVKGPGVHGPGRKVYWVPDFQYKHFPDFFSAQERNERDAMYRRMFDEPGFLVLSSAAVQADFLRFFPDYRHKPVRVLHFTSVIDQSCYLLDPATVCDELGLPPKFVYLPNQMWQHKGFDTAFDAVGILRKRGVIIPLVCTGNPQDYRNGEYYRRLQEVVAANGLGEQIIHLGVLPRTTQLQLYRRAALTLQPSRFEGWSTSVEDARALGRPLLLSDIAVHREQDPAGATFFKTGDPYDLAERLAALWESSKPGPDSGGERAAAQHGMDRSLAYARSFMSIMAEAAKP